MRYLKLIFKFYIPTTLADEHAFLQFLWPSLRIRDHLTKGLTPNLISYNEKESRISCIFLERSNYDRSN